MDYPPNSTVLYYLQRVETFLESEKKSQIFPEISKGLQEILKEVVRELNSLNISGYDDDVKASATNILSIINANKNVFKLNYELQTGDHGKDVFMYRKVFLNEVKAPEPLRKPSEYQTPLTDIATDSSVSSKFKLQCLNATVKFVKDDTQLVFNYPEMATEQAEFVMDMLLQGNKVATENTDVGFGYKCLYAALWDSMKTFSLKYHYKIDYVKPKHDDMKQIVFQKVPKLKFTEDLGNLFSKSTPYLTRKVTEMPNTLSEDNQTMHKTSKIVISTTDNIASNYDKIRANSDTFAPNNDKIAPNSDKCVSDYDKINPNSDNFASNCVKIETNSDNWTSKNDKIAPNSDKFTSNNDKTERNSDNSASNNRIVPKIDLYPNLASSNLATYNYPTTSTSHNTNTNSNVTTQPVNKAETTCKAMKLIKKMLSTLKSISENFVSDCLEKIKNFCLTQSEGSLQFLSMDEEQYAFLRRVKSMSKHKECYMLFSSDDQKNLDHIRYWIVYVGKYRLQVDATKVKGVSDITFIKCAVNKKTKIQNRIKVNSDSDPDNSMEIVESDSEQSENKICSKNVTVSKKTKKNIRKIIKEMDPTFIHTSLKNIHDFLFEKSIETELVINKLSFGEARLLILLHKVVKMTEEYELFEDKCRTLLSGINARLSKVTYAAEVFVYYDKDETFRRIKFTKAQQAADKENDPPKTSAKPKPLVPVNAPVITPATTPVTKPVTMPAKSQVDVPVKIKSDQKSIKAKMIEALAQPVQSDIAMKMMLNMGWDGGALGVRGDGIVEPIVPALDLANRAGLGHVKQKPPTKQPKEKGSKAKVSNEKVTTTKVSNEKVTTAKVSNEKVTATKVSNEKVTTAKVSNEKGLTVKVSNEKGPAKVSEVNSSYMTPECLPTATVSKNTRSQQHLRALKKVLELISNDMDFVLVEYPLPEILTRKEYNFVLEIVKNVNSKKYVPLTECAQKRVAEDIAIEYRHIGCLRLGVQILNPQTIEIEKLSITKLSQNLQSNPKLSKPSQDMAFTCLILAEILNFCQTDTTSKIVDAKHILDAKKVEWVKNMVNTLNSSEKVSGTGFYVNIVGDIRREMSGISLTCSFEGLNTSFKLQKTFNNNNEKTATKTPKDLAMKNNFVAESKNIQITIKNDDVKATESSNELTKNIKIDGKTPILKENTVKDANTNSTDSNHGKKDHKTVDINQNVKSEINHECKIISNGKTDPKTGNSDQNSKDCDTGNISKVNVIQTIKSEIVENNQKDKQDTKYCDNDDKITKNNDNFRVKCTESLDKSENIKICQDKSERIVKNIQEEKIETPKTDVGIQVNIEKRNAISCNNSIIDNSNDAKRAEENKVSSVLANANVEDVRKRLHSPLKKQNVKKFKALADFKTLYILPSDHPNKTIDKKKACEIQRHVLQTIDYTREDLPLLNCNGIQNGGLVYSCQDEKSVFFMEDIIKKMADLKIVYEFDVTPKNSRKLTFKINSFIEEDTSNMLQRIELYNKELSTKNWVIVKKEQYSDFIVLYVEVDENSFNYVCNANFILFAGNDCARFSIVWESN